jgi:regulatory protein
MPAPIDEQFKKCWLQALAALNRREHSRLELGRKLALKLGADGEVHPQERVESVLDRLVERGWLSDDRYAGALARSRVSRGQGPRRIQHELQRQGVADTIAEQALADCEVDWQAQARELVERRWGEEDLRRTPVERKALSFLLRRGFEMDVARRALYPSEG